LANAVIVVERDGEVLVHSLPSGRLELPRQELDGWAPIESQVKTWLAQFPCEKSAPELISVEGTPGATGVDFLYAATLVAAPSANRGELWLDYEAAKVALDAADRRLLTLCASRAARS
jgi:hypothetical protein